jgi:cell division protein FtsW
LTKVHGLIKHSKDLIHNKEMKSVQNIDLKTQISLIYFFLLVLGVFQVYSSSSIYALEIYQNSWFFVKKQAIFAVASALIFLVASRLPLRWFLILGGVGFVGSLLALAATQAPGVGVSAGGATRWIQLPLGFRLEPGEFLKVGFGFLIFWLLTFKEKFVSFSFWWPFSLLYLAIVAIFLRQPDFGSVILLTLSTLVVLFFMIKKVWPFITIGLLSLSGLLFFVTQKSYRLERLMTYLDPWRDPQGQGYQIIQSLMAFRKGGFFGEGLGMSEAKFFFLPEAHTDFTLAVFAEEWGFLGVILLLAIFMRFVFIALKLSKESLLESDGISYLSYYLACLFFFYVFINFSVNIGLLPTKGLSLPFLSYGGSSLISVTIIFSFFGAMARHLDR